MSSLKSRMAALKKGMGIGSTDVKGTKLPHTAAATDATYIQLRLALIIYVSKLFVLFATMCACAPDVLRFRQPSTGEFNGSMRCVTSGVEYPLAAELYIRVGLHQQLR